ncbi:MAG: IS3 family transposase, partial [Nitrospirales bacterium]
EGGARYLKKSRGVLCQGTPMKYAFIRAHRQEFRLTRLCQVLEVSRSGFYAWEHRPESQRAQQNRLLLTRMHVLHQETREAYGARKMWQCLRQEG